MRASLSMALTAALLTSAAPAYAGFEDVALGARPLGMGSAFTGLADDANDVYWNPAGLTQVKRQEASLMHGTYGGVDGVNFDYLAYVYPMSYSAIGVGWSEIGATLDEGDGQSSSSSRLTQDMYYLSVGLNPALFGNDQLTVGATLKRLTLNSSLNSGSGLGFDFGMLFKPFEWAQAGFTLRNVATDVINENFPMTMRLGLASHLFSDHLTLVADVATVSGVGSVDQTQYQLHYGMEYSPWRILAVRVGADNGDFTAGGGVNYRSFKLDYGFEASELLGNIQRVSLGLSFGPEGAGYVRPEDQKEQAASSIQPPVNLKGGYIEGRVMAFWEASPSVGVAGYNLYLKADGDKWTKVNESLIFEDKKAAAFTAEKGETYHLSVTAVGVDKSESPRSQELTVIAR